MIGLMSEQKWIKPGRFLQNYSTLFKNSFFQTLRMFNKPRSINSKGNLLFLEVAAGYTVIKSLLDALVSRNIHSSVCFYMLLWQRRPARAPVSRHLPLQEEKRLSLAQKVLQNLTPLRATGSSCGSPGGGDHIKQKLIPPTLMPAHAELQNELINWTHTSSE